MVAFSTDSLNFFDLANSYGRFNVLEMNAFILVEVDNRTEKVKQTFVGLELHEQIDQFISSELFMVLAANLNANFQILPDVSLQHGAKTFY